MCSDILSHLICNIYTDCIISCCLEKWNRTFLPCSCECLLFILSCWLLPGWFKRADRQLRATMRSTARMETAKTLLLCVCLTFVSLRCTEVRDMNFIFSYHQETDGPFFSNRSQIRQIVHLNTSEGLGKFRKMLNFLHWAIFVYFYWTFKEIRWREYWHNPLRALFYFWSFMSILKREPPDAVLTVADRETNRCTYGMSRQQSEPLPTAAICKADECQLCRDACSHICML